MAVMWAYILDDEAVAKAAALFADRGMIYEFSFSFSEMLNEK